MELSHIIILAVIQGLTEFLPISSSAHLVFIPQLLGWKDQGLAFDVAVHVGTLTAILWYFRHDLRPLLVAWWQSCLTRQLTDESRLVWGVGLGTIPVALIGLIMSVLDVDEALRTTLIIAITTIIFGLLLGYADKTGTHRRTEYQLTWRDIAIIGIAQAIAVIPGVSRSGITMTAALLVGLNRTASARFSFLLSIPIIILAGGMETLKLLKQADQLVWLDMGLGVLFSAISAYLCIRLFMGLLEKMGMMPFVIYRLVLGAFLLIWISQ
ncbi:undecaprenyl-diphosphate phosphatase [Beggiatoa leptomitoformis]|uniref:Undecaprenyl-diphosphatase n=1 Tax=Beggiatoa leptomitoformis TaxID=288004 RepID=A0A2N9YI33_9GAMM|nr:undecaprenyl-diphosphate phosphatase [Beggiatoa leptomitoformis]ALG67600.1 undecaprenyl-diphosphate phosphatase [Beggiatoa leptomitoformis]AUI70167.1 undecaprenyl-diphosphate phosphatase [Beggiatoa leptomitoformis]